MRPRLDIIADVLTLLGIGCGAAALAAAAAGAWLL